jgi:DNA-binding MarR family transcriptional regulator
MKMRSNKEPDSPIDVEKIGNIDKYIHEPSRLKILAHLYSLKVTDFVYLKRVTGFTWGRLSSHLDKLESVGYIQLEKKLISKPKSDKKTPTTYIKLTKTGKRAFESYTESMREIFS